MSGIVGREAELATVHAFVASVSGGAAALVLEGEAGMGKTTLWGAGVDMARESELLVLQARPSESETALSFSGIGDLLDPVLAPALECVSPAQRRALSCALVLEEADDDGDADPHAVGVAVLSALRSLASGRPLLVAVDDVQWLDSASTAALAYAARRLGDETVGVLLARRTPLQSPLLAELRRSLAADRFTELEVGALDPAALHGVVQRHLDVVLPRPLLNEVHTAAAGNPFFALEIVRTLRRSGASVEAGHPLPVPESLHELVHGRLLALPSDSRAFLLAASAHAHPTIAVTESASGVDRAAGLTPALEARIVELEGDRIRFTHPLLAAGAYETADPLRRTEVHARLADLLDDPEARAWQLAASVEEPDEDVASVLEDAARSARSRGAPRPAALLLDRARELTPAGRPEDAVRRAVDGAYLHYEAGDSPRARAQLRALIAELPAGRQRARALMRLGRVQAYTALSDAARLFLQAVDEAEGDVQVLAVAHEGVATSFFRLYERLPEAAEHAELAAGFALELGDRALAAEALGTRWVVEVLLGRDSTESCERALALQEAAEHARALAQPRFTRASVGLMSGNRLADARGEFVALLERAAEIGDESSRPLVLGHLAELECDAGELEAALATAAEAREAAQQAGQETVFAYSVAVQALAEGMRGAADRARRLAHRALELMPQTGGREAEMVATRALGHVELSLGAADAAVAVLEPLVAFIRRQGIVEPGLARFVVDAVEALVELGRRDEAVELLDWYEGNARRLGRESALAACLRCRGLLSAQAGAVDEAVAAFEDALELHARGDLPLDRGRTLLALGAAQRRLKRRREARATLEEAEALFERIGAALWADRARAELRRISGRAATPGALTPAEERVAALVAEGKTNREVAAALFLSDRTVEGHLSHVFGKLGIKHRSELARALAARETQGIPASNPGDSPVSSASSAP